MTTLFAHGFTAFFLPAEEGGYTVVVPELPGCISEGDTLEEARQNIQEAVELYEEVVQEGEIPFPFDVTEAPIQMHILPSSVSHDTETPVTHA